MGNKVFYEISLYQYYVSFHRCWTISYPMFLDILRIPQPVMFFLHSEAWLSYLVFQAWISYHILWKTVTNWALSQFSSVAQSCPTLRDPMNCSTITNSRSLLKLMSIESVMPSNHLILCWPLLLQPSIFPSIRVFSNESVLRIRWPKYWSFSFSISPSNEQPGLISFRMDWLDLLAVQGTIKSLLQHHSSKASMLWCPVSFIVQLSHPYMTTSITHALSTFYQNSNDLQPSSYPWTWLSYSYHAVSSLPVYLLFKYLISGIR